MEAERDGERPGERPDKPPKSALKSRRGVETLFRVSYREQLELTALADSKASIMIQVNGLIMSIMLAAAGLVFRSQPWMLWPCGALGLTALISIVFAVFAARPKLNKLPEITIADIKSGKANILFFGNFARISEDQFVAGMRELVEDPEAIYVNMMRHIHGLGSVLLMKFRLLRVSYTVFLFGLFASVAVFAYTVSTLEPGAPIPQSETQSAPHSRGAR